MKNLRNHKEIKSSLHLASLIMLSACLIFIILNLFYGIITDGVYMLFPIIERNETSRIIIDSIIYLLGASISILAIIKLIMHWKNTESYREEKKKTQNQI